MDADRVSKARAEWKKEQKQADMEWRMFFAEAPCPDGKGLRVIFNGFGRNGLFWCCCQRGKARGQ